MSNTAEMKIQNVATLQDALKIAAQEDITIVNTANTTTPENAPKLNQDQA